MCYIVLQSLWNYVAYIGLAKCYIRYRLLAVCYIRYRLLAVSYVRYRLLAVCYIVYRALQGFGMWLHRAIKRGGNYSATMTTYATYGYIVKVFFADVY